MELLGTANLSRVLPFERGDCCLRPARVLVVNLKRPVRVVDPVDLVGDALLVQDQREVHRTAEVASGAEEHLGSLPAATGRWRWSFRAETASSRRSPVDRRFCTPGRATELWRCNRCLPRT